MAVVAGSPDAILSGAVGGNGGVTDPLPDSTEGLTRGHWSGLDLDQFPPLPSNPPAGWPANCIPLEPIYPIVPERKNNTLTFRTDNKAWKDVQKSEQAWSHEVNKLKYKVVNAFYLKDIVDFIKSHKGQLVNLSTPGVQPFMKTSELNAVFIKSYSKPKRIAPKTYTIDILFLFDPNEL